MGENCAQLCVLCLRRFVFHDRPDSASEWRHHREWISCSEIYGFEPVGSGFVFPSKIDLFKKFSRLYGSCMAVLRTQGQVKRRRQPASNVTVVKEGFRTGPHLPDQDVPADFKIGYPQTETAVVERAGRTFRRSKRNPAAVRGLACRGRGNGSCVCQTGPICGHC